MWFDFGEHCFCCFPLSFSLELFQNKIFGISGEGNIIATKITSPLNFHNCLWATRVMESGKHRMSLKLTGGGARLAHLFGLVRDGAAWDKDHSDEDSTDAWYLHSQGSLCGNGKEFGDEAGMIKEGQIVSMEADLDKGTLRFWVDGKQHGPGYSSGVQGHLRWAVSLCYENTAAEIVPTQELQPWSASWVRPECGDGSGGE
jgi:hypothetical protein